MSIVPRSHSKTPKKRWTWTMHDVAREAGVSVKTVSRVVNGEPGVSETTRHRVARLIEEVGYFPHTGARSMRSTPRDCVGVTIPAPTEEVPVSQKFFIQLFAELYRIFGTKGQYICFDVNPFKLENHINYARGLWEQRYWGCVLCGPLSPADPTIFKIHESGHPYMALGRLDSLPDCSSATVDYEEAAAVSTLYLLNRGHKRVGFLKGFQGYQPGFERYRGYVRACQEAGAEVDESLIRVASFASRDVINAVHRLLLDRSVTAFVEASGSEDSESVREGCRRAGRVPGKDVEIVAWTYTPNSTTMREACAHVWLPVWQAAMDGLEQFARWFSGETDSPVKVLYRPTLYKTLDTEELPKPTNLFDLSE